MGNVNRYSVFFSPVGSGRISRSRGGAGRGGAGASTTLPAEHDDGGGPCHGQRAQGAEPDDSCGFRCVVTEGTAGLFSCSILVVLVILVTGIVYGWLTFGVGWGGVDWWCWRCGGKPLGEYHTIGLSAKLFLCIIFAYRIITV